MADAYIRDDQKEELFFNVFNAMYEKQLIHNLIELFPEPKKEAALQRILILQLSLQMDLYMPAYKNFLLLKIGAMSKSLSIT